MSRTAHHRIHALDWMRGAVMVLMTIDHASGAFNAGRVFSDSARFYRPGTELPADQFLTRWITHLCAPVFIFLAGVALSISVQRRRARGDSNSSIDRHLAIRGGIILAIEVAWMSLAFVPGRILFQVLYAIGASLLCMVWLRRLPRGWLLAIGVALVLGSEALAGLLNEAGAGRSIVTALLVTGGRAGRLIVAYPLLPWLGIMILGWCAADLFSRPREGIRLPIRLLVTGVGALGVFALVRGLNGYGNWLLYREGHSLVQWLHVSKYPPGISFTTLELGIMALFLAGFLWIERSEKAKQFLQPLGLLGQTALFFYILHAHLLKLSAWALDARRSFGLGATYLAAAITVVVLLPLCWWYLKTKRAHPRSWLQYI